MVSLDHLHEPLYYCVILVTRNHTFLEFYDRPCPVHFYIFVYLCIDIYSKVHQ